MIGVYNYTVALTYTGFLVAVVGIYFAINNSSDAAIICLMICGFCDMFDGKVAKTKKDRTEEEKQFGVQIDSLCDLVCFGVLPAFIGYSVGLTEVYFFPILLFFPLAALIRLAYFNVTESERVKNDDGELLYCTGLPVTTVALFLPIVYLTRPFLNSYFIFLFALSLLIISVLFITPIKLKRFKMKQYLISIVIGLAIIVLMGVFR